MFAILFGLKTISPSALHDQLGRAGLFVCDVNAPLRWSQGHVPGAVNLDHQQFTVDQLPPDKDATLVFYCSNPMCRKAPQAGRRAKGMGYRDVRVMSAGIQGWLTAGFAIARG